MQRSLMPKMSKKRAALLAAADRFPATTFVVPTVTPTVAPRRIVVRRPVASTGPDAATVEVVLDRDGYCCVVCGLGIGLPEGRGVYWSVHHRLRRSQGLDNRPCNLISVCGNGTQGCHSDIHHSVGDAMVAGWLVRGTGRPESIPVLVGHRSRWVYLTPGGGYADEPGEVAA